MSDMEEKYKADEKQTLDILCKNTNFIYKQTYKYCRYDAEIYDKDTNELKAIVEIKNRSVNSTSFDTWFISYRKWVYGKMYAKDLKCRIILAAGYLDGVFYIDITNKKIDNEIKKDYNEKMKDELVYIPIYKLTRKE
jgi:sensor histidine kinase YesM